MSPQYLAAIIAAYRGDIAFNQSGPLCPPLIYTTKTRVPEASGDYPGSALAAAPQWGWCGGVRPSGVPPGVGPG